MLSIYAANHNDMVCVTVKMQSSINNNVFFIIQSVPEPITAVRLLVVAESNLSDTREKLLKIIDQKRARSEFLHLLNYANNYVKRRNAI